MEILGFEKIVLQAGFSFLPRLSLSSFFCHVGCINYDECTLEVGCHFYVQNIFCIFLHLEIDKHQ